MQSFFFISWHWISAHSESVYYMKLCKHTVNKMLEANFREIWTATQTFLFWERKEKYHLLFCSGFNVPIECVVFRRSTKHVYFHWHLVWYQLVAVSNRGQMTPWKHGILYFGGMGHLPDMQNCGLRMSRECRECLPLSPRVSDPDMHHGTFVTHVPWCMLG